MVIRSTPYALSVEHAKKLYPAPGRGKRMAVKDVSFYVHAGEVHGLLGPNGAGKTTTLKMLLGLVRPTGGLFAISGTPITPSAREDVGFLPEQPYYPTQLTAEEVLTLYGRLSGLSRTQVKERAPELLEQVGLQGRENVLLSHYSRGMLQRLGIAQALIHRPGVVILDEPASGLDPVGQRDVRNLILDLRERGVTILLSSHQLSEVEAVCDQVTILNRGTVAATGSIDDLLNVEGQVSFRVRGAGDSLPVTIADSVSEVAFAGGEWMFSVSSGRVRATVDGLYDAGWTVVSLAPKRDSLEDYFSRLLASTSEEVVL